MRVASFLCAVLVLCGCDSKKPEASKESEKAAIRTPLSARAMRPVRVLRIKREAPALENPADEAVVALDSDAELTVVSWKRPAHPWTAVFSNSDATQPQSPCLFRKRFSNVGDSEPSLIHRCVVVPGCDPQTFRPVATDSQGRRFCVYKYAIFDGQAVNDPEVWVEEGPFPPPDELQKLSKKLETMQSK